MSKRYARMAPQQATLLDSDQPIPVEKWRKMQKGEGPSKSEQLHAKFLRDCTLHGLPAPIAEHQFAKAALGRRWEFDFCWPQFNVAVEIEGIVVKRVWVAHFAEGSPKPVFVNGRVVNFPALRFELKSELVSVGRHASIDGLREDCVKYNSANLLGWHVLRFEQSQIRDRDAVEMTVRVLAARGWTS
jgi:hypothetical protein